MFKLLLKNILVYLLLVIHTVNFALYKLKIFTLDQYVKRLYRYIHYRRTVEATVKILDRLSPEVVKQQDEKSNLFVGVVRHDWITILNEKIKAKE